MRNFKATIVCVLAGAALGFSQSPGSGLPGGMQDMPPFDPSPVMHGAFGNPPQMMMNVSELQSLMSEINIDKTVATRIVAIARAFLKSLDERILKMQREELTIKEELLKDKPDMGAIQNAISRKSQVLSDIEFAQIKRDLEIKALLTQDEYDRWKFAMMKKMRERMPRFIDNAGPNGQFGKQQGAPK